MTAMRINLSRQSATKTTKSKSKVRASFGTGTKTRRKGQVLESQSPWRLSFITDAIWGIINFIVLFFQTLINPNRNSRGDNYTSDYRRPGGGGPPTRRMGGFRGGRGAPGPPPMAGGG